jgi:PAS domain S-box-containing protein
MAMTREDLLEAFIESLGQPFVFVDTGHMIRYVSRTAESHYGMAKCDLLGKSIFDCHNPESCRIIREIFTALGKGEEERLITDNARHRIWMRAVRGLDGRLLGYFERYERPCDIPDEAADH